MDERVQCKVTGAPAEGLRVVWGNPLNQSKAVEGNKNIGLDIEAEVPAVKDMLEAGVLDTYLGKHWAIKLATNAAVTVLRVDQIIMAKPAGGPKPPSGKKDWDEDQND